jgi:myo-inositol-1(or 4)-monophosphatase
LKNLGEKFQAGLVSDADRESEAFIKAHILKSFPDHEILGEETGLTGGQGKDSAGKKGGEKGGPPLWYIDPLDGTTNYVHRFPFFCISIGLEVEGQLAVGVVDAPKLGQRFHASKGRGAFVNGEPMRVSNRTQFREGLFATGFSSSDNRLDEQLEIVACSIREARGIRRAGAAALDLCFVADGIFDVFWEKNLSAWDTAAGALIAAEAGAVVTDMNGNDYHPKMSSILCGTPALHAEMLARMKQIHAANAPL